MNKYLKALPAALILAACTTVPHPITQPTTTDAPPVVVETPTETAPTQAPVATSEAPVAPSVDPIDALLVQAVRKVAGAASDPYPDSDIVALGHAICDDLSNGYPLVGIIQEGMAYGDDVATVVAATAGAAIYAYCPQFTDQLEGRG